MSAMHQQALLLGDELAAANMAVMIARMERRAQEGWRTAANGGVDPNPPPGQNRNRPAGGAGGQPPNQPRP